MKLVVLSIYVDYFQDLRSIVTYESLIFKCREANDCSVYPFNMKKYPLNSDISILFT